MPSTHGPRLELHDVDNAEGFVSAIVGRSGLSLSWDDREDLKQFLLIEAWELSLRYHPGVVRKGFSTWAGIILRRRVVDWQRKRLGRTIWRFKGRVHTRPQVKLVSLNDDDSDLDSLGAAVPGSELDDAEDRLATESGLHGKRSRPPAGYAAEVRKGVPREAA
jgi:DNA-directed RNA polymerase specialized sigma24 family protein